MKLLGLIGSPRKESNTDIVVDQVLEGSKIKGHVFEKIYLYNFNIKACIDCRTCKKGAYVCTINDDMQTIYPKLEAADIIIFGTPIYWYGPTAQMKLLIDRLRPYIANKKMNGKKAIVIAPSEEGVKACGPLIEMFRMSFEYLGIEFIKQILPKAYEKGEIKENSDLLNQAYEFGRSI